MKKIMTISLMIMFTLLLVSCDTTSEINPNLLTSDTLPLFTLDDVSSYTGANGSTAYIIVDGIVYDVTDAFDNGKHQGIQVGGTDATELFSASPHSASLLETLPIVGSFTSDIPPVTTSNDETNNDTTTPITQESLPVFTLNELSQYTGTNGSIAYIAVSGVIYDVTNEFNNGQHQGMQLGGTDATDAFASSPHSASFLSSLTIIGSLEGFDPIIVETINAGETLPVFTLNELSQYSGVNGTTAYIAVNGVIYDVTNEFSNGQHKGMQLGGTDATDAFATSPHSASFLSSLTIVGSLEGYETILLTDTVTQPDYDNNNDDDDDYDDDHDDDDDYDDDHDDHDND